MAEALLCRGSSTRLVVSTGTRLVVASMGRLLVFAVTAESCEWISGVAMSCSGSSSLEGRREKRISVRSTCC